MIVPAPPRRYLIHRGYVGKDKMETQVVGEFQFLSYAVKYIEDRLSKEDDASLWGIQVIDPQKKPQSLSKSDEVRKRE